jgi:hypothetical protein
MKTKKLNLGSLEVQSFVTSLEPASQAEVKAGSVNLSKDVPTQPCNCSAIDACITAFNCTITRGIIC